MDSGKAIIPLHFQYNFIHVRLRNFVSDSGWSQAMIPSFGIHLFSMRCTALVSYQVAVNSRRACHIDSEPLYRS